MPDPELNPLFQVGLDVRGRRCLVIGGGHEAEDKTRKLLEAGGCVVVVSPDATSALQGWGDEGRLQRLERRYQPGDLEAAFLAMNTVRGDPQLVGAVFEEAESRGVLVNTYDDVTRSHFGMAALVTAGPLRISISTSNASPSLASRLRRDLEALFGEEFVEYLGALARVRAHLKRTEPEFAERRRTLRSLVEGARLEGDFHLPQDWRTRVQAALESLGEAPEA